MIESKSEQVHEFKLTEGDRFEWVKDDGPFIVETIQMRLTTGEPGARLYLRGPWVKTPERFSGTEHSTMGWAFLYTELEHQLPLIAKMPDNVLIALGVRGLDTNLLPL